MLNKKEVKYSLNDIQIIPDKLSYIKSRSECNPYNEEGMLPLFTAPMNTVVDESNYQLFKENKITPIIPRTVSINKRMNLLKKGEWVAFGLEECNDIFFGIDEESFIIKLFLYFDKIILGQEKIEDYKFHILIDIANGHMYHLYDLVKRLKEKYNCVIMVGNIANPETYKYCCEQGVDFVRLGIGGGSGCLTASNTSIYYPTGSLIDECYEISQDYKNPTKIIADGGMKNYSDIIKSLALGADYCMCGGLFAKMLETPGQVTFTNSPFDTINQYDFDLKSLEQHQALTKRFMGMSSKQAQSLMGKETLKTSEGLTKWVRIEYTMEQWRINFEDYLKSSMSYTGSTTLDRFKESNKIIVSQNASQSFNK